MASVDPMSPLEKQTLLSTDAGSIDSTKAGS